MGDLWDDFCNFGETKAEYKAAKPQSEIQIKPSEEAQVIDHKREEKGAEYAARHVVKEEQRLATQTLNVPAVIDIDSSSDSNDGDQELGLKQENEEAELPELSVFQRYSFSLNPQQLPILRKKGEILSHIQKNKVIVLTASTGTGKSSQGKR